MASSRNIPWSVQRQGLHTVWHPGCRLLRLFRQPVQRLLPNELSFFGFFASSDIRYQPTSRCILHRIPNRGHGSICPNDSPVLSHVSFFQPIVFSFPSNEGIVPLLGPVHILGMGHVEYGEVSKFLWSVTEELRQSLIHYQESSMTIHQVYPHCSIVETGSILFFGCPQCVLDLLALGDVPEPHLYGRFSSKFQILCYDFTIKGRSVFSLSFTSYLETTVSPLNRA